MPTPPTRDRQNRQQSDRPSARRQSRLVRPDGNFDVVRLGANMPVWADPYHVLLMLSWPQFLGLVGLLYGVTNGVFAGLYLLAGDGIANAQPGSFADAFFFSVQTMASIGYGAMYPTTLYTNVLVTIESLVGLLGLAMGTGLMFARFARPTARLLFSSYAVICEQNGVPMLMFRAANQRQNRILEAQLRLTLVRTEQDDYGHEMRRFYDLELTRSHNPIFALTWTVMHPITQDSPLYDVTQEQLAEVDGEVIVTLVGIDETFSQTIHARHSYIASEVLWNTRFVDILSKTPDGRRAIHYSRFHDTESL